MELYLTCDLAESVNAILDALNEATNGNVNERRDRLRRAVGLH
jgi:hypothetical protein